MAPGYALGQLPPRSAAAAIKAEMFQCVRSPRPPEQWHRKKWWMFRVDFREDPMNMVILWWFSGDLPSGKLRVCELESHHLQWVNELSMIMFNSYVIFNQRASPWVTNGITFHGDRIRLRGWQTAVPLWKQEPPIMAWESHRRDIYSWFMIARLVCPISGLLYRSYIELGI